MIKNFDKETFIIFSLCLTIAIVLTTSIVFSYLEYKDRDIIKLENGDCCNANNPED